jgi:hypothetical protein
MLQNNLLLKSLSALVLVSCVLHAFGQSGPNIKQDANNASCSNIVALSGNVEINCSSLTRAQQKQIESIPSILHKILINQLDSESVMLALDEIRDRLPKTKGVLLPANDPDPLPGCKTEEGQLKLVLGTSAFISPAGESIFRVGDCNWVNIKRSGAGISLDADLVGEDQNIAVQIRDNKFVLNPNNVFNVQMPNDSTLIVSSTHTGSEMLNVRFSNKTTIRINAIFYREPGVRIVVNELGINKIGGPGGLSINYSCVYNSGAFAF